MLHRPLHTDCCVELLQPRQHGAHRTAGAQPGPVGVQTAARHHGPAQVRQCIIDIVTHCSVLYSLVAVQSSPDQILDHWYRLVDTTAPRPGPGCGWVELPVGPDGRVSFSRLGVVRVAGRERGREVAARVKARREEAGQRVEGDRWQEQNILQQAEHQCCATSPAKLKLCFEAFLQGPAGRLVAVAAPVFSAEVEDQEQQGGAAAELAIQELSACSDTADGGAKLLAFTKNIKTAKQTFHVRFYEEAEVGPGARQAGCVWERRVTVAESELRVVGSVLAGLTCRVPRYDRQPLLQPTERVFLQLEVTGRGGTRRGDPLPFTYRPSLPARSTRPAIRRTAIQAGLGQLGQHPRLARPVFQPQFRSSPLPTTPVPPVINIPHNLHLEPVGLPIQVADTFESSILPESLPGPLLPPPPPPVAPAPLLPQQTVQAPIPLPLAPASEFDLDDILNQVLHHQLGDYPAFDSVLPDCGLVTGDGATTDTESSKNKTKTKNSEASLSDTLDNLQISSPST